MNIAYHKWLDIEVMNNYFQDGKCPVLQLHPFTETSRSLNNYAILIQKNDNLFSCYVGIPEGDDSNIKEKLSGLKDLYFQVFTEDYTFLNYSDLPTIPLQKMYCFKNAKNKNSFQLGDEISEADLVVIRQEQLPVDPPSDTNIIEIKDDLGITLQKEPDPNTDLDPINLNFLDSGLYQLWVNNDPIERFYHFKTAFLENCLGVLHIDVSSLEDPLPQQTLKRTLQFKPRLVYWQYQIILPEFWKLKQVDEHDQIKITCIFNNTETFTDLSTKTQIMGGKTALVFTSNIPMPLVKNPTKHPQLTLTYTDTRINRETDFSIKLPNPGAEELKIIDPGTGEKSLCSTTIIYV